MKNQLQEDISDSMTSDAMIDDLDNDVKEAYRVSSESQWIELPLECNRSLIKTAYVAVTEDGSVNLYEDINSRKLITSFPNSCAQKLTALNKSYVFDSIEYELIWIS